MAVPVYLQNISNYFKSLASSEAVRASMPRDWPSAINERDGKLVGLCNFFKIKRLADISTRVLASVVATPTTVNIAAAATEQMTATAMYDNGDDADVTSSAMWESDNELVATVDSDGLVTGVGAGTANVTATYQGEASNAVVVTVT